ncbi:MAG: hypothetical protein AB4352_20195 [Hormoscilla sp.]
MKKVVIALIAAIAMLFISSPAHADYIDFRAGSSTDAPPYSGGHVEYTPYQPIYNANPTTDYIEIEIAGKTCSFLSSYKAFGAWEGCNYSVEITPSGDIEFPRTGCEQPVCK